MIKRLLLLVLCSFIFMDVSLTHYLEKVTKEELKQMIENGEDVTKLIRLE